MSAAVGITPGAEDGDVISIGPGDFAGGMISTNRNIRFVGAGAGTLDAFDPSIHTRLRLTSDGSPTLKLAGSGGALEKLRIDAFPGANINNAVWIDPPFGLEAKAYELNDVTLWASGLKGNGLLIYPTGGPSRADVTITGSRLSGGGDDNEARAILVAGNQNPISVTVIESFLTAVFDAIETRVGSLTIRRSTVEARERGIDAGADLAVERSTIRGAETGIRLVGDEGGQSVVVKSSLVETDMPTGFPSRLEAPISVDSAPAGGIGNVNLDLLGSTLIGRGPVDGGLVVNTEVGETAVADVRGSAVVATGTELRTLGTGTETISASSSAFADSAGNAPAAGSGTNIGADPMLGSDFHPLAGSPLIDKSDPGFFAPGDLDLAGTARGSTPDIGAFEYLPPGPGSVPNVAPVVSLVSMSNRPVACCVTLPSASVSIAGLLMAHLPQRL